MKIKEEKERVKKRGEGLNTLLTKVFCQYPSSFFTLLYISLPWRSRMK